MSGKLKMGHIYTFCALFKCLCKYILAVKREISKNKTNKKIIQSMNISSVIFLEEGRGAYDNSEG
jgi:hypothetical protein